MSAGWRWRASRSLQRLEEAVDVGRVECGGSITPSACSVASRALLAECEARGLRQIVAVIGDSTNCASIRLHKSLGFREVGVLRSVGFKFDRWVDSVLMQRDLVAGDSTPP